MNVQWFDGIAVMRLDPGEEVVAILREFATQENIRGAMFQGIGAFARVDLRYFDIAEDRYKSRPLDEQVEVVSLLGSIGRDQDTLVIHTHAAVADSATRTHSGHLNTGIVSPTLEIFLTVLNSTLGRKKDPATGLELLDLKATPGRS